MILTQMVLRIFCSQDYFTIQDAEKGHNSVKYLQDFAKS